MIREAPRYPWLLVAFGALACSHEHSGVGSPSASPGQGVPAPLAGWQATVGGARCLSPVGYARRARSGRRVSLGPYEEVVAYGPPDSHTKGNALSQGSSFQPPSGPKRLSSPQSSLP